MSNYTIDDILEKINRQINYEELGNLLSLDLNTIVEQIAEEPEDLISFKAFFDHGDFETAVDVMARGEGHGPRVTPVLLSLIGGSYANEKGPEIFQLQFRIEALGFLENVDILRKTLEAFSALNQGAILTDFFGAQTVSITDFPAFTEQFQLKGFERVSGFMTWWLTFVFEGELSSNMRYEINGVPLDIFGFNIKRSRSGKPIQKNNDPEQRTKPDSQLTVMGGTIIHEEGHEAKDELLRSIVDENYGLQNTFELKVKYTEGLTQIYRVYLNDGELIAQDGGYLTMNCVFVLV